MTNIELMKNYLLGYVKRFIKDYYVFTEISVTPLSDRYTVSFKKNNREAVFIINCYTNIFGESGVVITQNFSDTRIVIPIGKIPIIETPISYINIKEPRHCFTEFSSVSDVDIVSLCRYITFKMYLDGILATDLDEILKSNNRKENIKNNKMFTTTKIFNPDYWHVGDAIEFTRVAKKGESKEPCLLTRATLIEKVGYTTIEVEYVDNIRVGMTITLDDVQTGKVKIRKLN